MKIRTIKRASKRESRIIFSVPNIITRSGVTERSDPTKATGLDYESTSGQSNIKSSSNCTKANINSPSYRLCYLKKFLKTSGIKYYYYDGHRYTPSQVISKKMGNCCDLSRLCKTILVSTSLPSGTAGQPMSNVRYVVGTIDYGGKGYRHAWIEVETQTATSGNDVITATGQDTCGRSKWTSPTTHTWKNQCASPTCRKVGTLRHGCHGADEITCCTSLGGCGADYCIVDGWCKAGNFPYRLTPGVQRVAVWNSFDPTSYVTSGSDKILGTVEGTPIRRTGNENPC